MQGFYQSVWERVSDGFELPNTVSENVQWDTAMAVGWLYDGLAVGAPVDFNYVASFAMPAPPTEPPVEPTPPTEPQPQPPVPGPQPPEPQDPANVAIRDPVFVPGTGGVVDVIGRCRTKPGGRCFIEVGTGRQRRAAVVRRGQLARLAFVLGRTQRRELRRDCATELNLRVAVYQPDGQRARTTRRTVSVFCASLRGRCAAVGSSAFAARPLASPPAVLCSCAGAGRRRLARPAEAGRALNVLAFGVPWPPAGHVLDGRSNRALATLAVIYLAASDSFQASAFALSCSNSAWLMAPLSSSSLARPISPAEPPRRRLCGRARSKLACETCTSWMRRSVRPLPFAIR